MKKTQSLDLLSVTEHKSNKKDTKSKKVLCKTKVSKAKKETATKTKKVVKEVVPKAKIAKAKKETATKTKKVVKEVVPKAKTAKAKKEKIVKVKKTTKTKQYKSKTKKDHVQSYIPSVFQNIKQEPPKEQKKVGLKFKSMKDLIKYTQTIYKDTADWIPRDQKMLQEANKKLKTKYVSWDDLSSNANLGVDFLSKYNEFINWYLYYKFHKENISQEVLNKFKKELKFMKIMF